MEVIEKVNRKEKILLLTLIALLTLIPVLFWVLIPPRPTRLTEWFTIVGLVYGVFLIMMPIGMWQEKKKKVWEKFATEMGLNYVKEKGRYMGFRMFPSLEGNYRNHYVEISLELKKTETFDGKPTYSRYTEYRVEFENRKEIFMSIYPESYFSKIGKVFGMQDIKLNDPEFDREFVIKGNNENSIKTILDPSICSKMMNMKNFRITIDQEKPNVAYSQEGGFVTNTARLRSVLDTTIDIVEKIEKE